MNEPTTTITTVDYTIGYSPDPPDNRLNILTPVISPQGPVDLTRVNGPSEYQRLFFGGRSVKSSDDFSAIFARGLVANAPIWIKRGVRNNIKGGLSSALAREVFTDSELNLIDGVKSYITFDKDSEGFVSYDETIESTINPVPMNLSGDPITITQSEDQPAEGEYRISLADGLIKITGYGTNALFTDGAGIDVDKLRCLKYGVRLVVSGTTSATVDHVVDYDTIIQEGALQQNVLSINSSITGESISSVTGIYIVNAQGQSTEQIVINETMVYATDINNIPVSLRATTPVDTPLKCGLAMDLTSISSATINIGNKAFHFTANSDGFSTSDLSALKKAGVFPQIFLDESFRTIAVRADKTGSITKIGNRPIVYILWNSGVGISSSDPNPQGFTIIQQEDIDNTAQYSFPTCLQGIIRDDDQYLEDYVVHDISFNIETSEGVTYCFYTGSVVPNADINVNLGDELTFEQFFEALVKQGSDLLHADSGEAHSIILPEVIQAGISDRDSVLVLANKILNDIVNNDKFAILSAFPCETNEITVRISEGSVSESYQLSVSYGTDSEIWEISFDSGVTDGYGNSLYYTNVNERSSYIRIVELSGPNVIYQTLNFGNEVTSKFCGVSEMQASLEMMKESDEASVDFDYITDGGYANPTFGSYIISQLCPYYNSFYVPSVQVGKTLNEDELIAYRDAICNSLAQGRLIAATQRTNVLDNGQTEMPASYFYLISRINLGNTVREFVKFMEETNGNIGMQNPIQKFTRTKRENLLDHQIVTLKKGRNGSWFLNECTTLYTSPSYLQEDGTVLMVNKINQLARAYGDPLKGQDNTTDLRSNVESELLRIINDRVRTGTPYGPINIRVVCNDTNNPVSLQNQRKLRIDIYGTFSRSIKDVLIYTNIIPLS